MYFIIWAVWHFRSFQFVEANRNETLIAVESNSRISKQAVPVYGEGPELRNLSVYCPMIFHTQRLIEVDYLHIN